MKRDIKNIVRYLDDNKNSDIIYKKSKLMAMFKEDPDLLEVLGTKQPRPLNKYKDVNHPTDDELQERRDILEYNELIKHDKIVPYLKLNGVQKEVNNYICYDIRDAGLARYNDFIKKQELWVMCMVYEKDMDTEFETVDGLKIPRVDLLAYIVNDLLAHSNSLGMELVPYADVPDIVDQRYYVRTLRYQIMAPNSLQGGGNRYDRFRKI